MRESDANQAELPDDLAEHAAEQLLAVPAQERAALLAALTVAHPQHAAGLQRLLLDLGGAEHLLDHAYPDHHAETATHIGGHRVLRRLGEGAFGIVFLCAQEQPVVRQVAVKVLRPGAGDQNTLRRFGAERQLLAALNHPAITQVFDAGELPDGRPYFVMEFVDGTSIRRYCEERCLACRDRLRLFVELCRGVAHAHKRGIVHRDLKPGNVLVVDTDAGPMPKIIDFGIAKALVAAAHGEGPRTDAGRVIGTPGYMSPEQAAGRIDEVDERADVFALGVMLYELLTGELPWAQGAAATDSEPMRPSARVTTATSSTVAAPLTQRRQLAAELRGDLDWITLHALARERGERYASVTALVADIERHLRGEPVSVGPPSATYRLRKFVRRNRVGVAAVGGAAVILAIGLAVALTQGSAAEAAVAVARQEVVASNAETTAVVEQLLMRANDARLRQAPQGDFARQALLQDALAFYERFLQERPTEPGLRVGRCKALLSISQVHWLLGEATRAGSAAAEAAGEAELLRHAEPGNLAYRGLCGEALRRQGHALALAANHTAAHPKFLAAVELLATCAATAPATYGRSHAVALREAAETLAAPLAEERLAGLRASQQALEALRQSQPGIAELVDDHVQVCISLASQFLTMHRLEEADAILATAAAEVSMVTADRSRLQHQILRQQGRVAFDRNDRPAALTLLQSAVDSASAWHQAQPQQMLPQEALAKSLRDLGWTQNYVNAFADSTASFRRSIAAADAMVLQFPDDPGRLVLLCRTLRECARIHWDRYRQQDLDEAAACAARVVEVDARIPATVDVGREPRWQMLAMQAFIEDSRGRSDAGRLWEQVEAALPTDLQGRQQQDQAMLINALDGLAHWHFANGRNEAAASYLALARERIAADKPQQDKCIVEVGWLEARLAAGRGDHAAVAGWGDTILAGRPTWFGKRRTADCLRLACQLVSSGPGADAALAAGYRERATRLYTEVIAELREDVAKDPKDPFYVLPWGFACVRAAGLAAAAGDTVQALELLTSALPKLEAVHAEAHADVWEADVVRDGVQLQIRLAAAAERR